MAGRPPESPPPALVFASCGRAASVIDVHAHAVLELVLGAAGEHGPELTEVDGEQRFRVGGYELCGVRYRGSVFMDPEQRIEAMDAAGIDLQVVSPNPLTYFHHIDAVDAAEFCRRHNDAMAALVAEHPGRLLGFATLPMQDVDAALVELRRAVGELGLVGAYIGTDFGRLLDDAALDGLYGLCVELDVPLFVHPAPSGIDGPLLDGRLRRFDLDLLLGFAYEESLAVATLVFGGVLERHPGLDVCVSHGGGAAAFLAGRWRQAAEVRPWSPEWLREPGAFDRLLRRLWFDVHVHEAGSLALLTQVVGTERLVLGTNFGGWDSGAGHVLDPSLGPTLDANALRLLRLAPT